MCRDICLGFLTHAFAQSHIGRIFGNAQYSAQQLQPQEAPTRQAPSSANGGSRPQSAPATAHLEHELEKSRLELQNLQLAVMYSESLDVPQRKQFFSEFFKFFRFSSGIDWWPNETDEVEEDAVAADEDEDEDVDEQAFEEYLQKLDQVAPLRKQYPPSTNALSVQAVAGSSAASLASLEDAAKAAYRDDLRRRYEAARDEFGTNNRIHVEHLYLKVFCRPAQYWGHAALSAE